MYNPAKANQYVSPDATGNVYAPAIYLTEPRGKSASELQLLFESWNANVSICLLERNSSISTIIACTGLIWSELASSVEHNLYSIFLGSDWGSTGVQLQPACPPSRDPCRWLKHPFESRTNRFIFFSCQTLFTLPPNRHPATKLTMSMQSSGLLSILFLNAFGASVLPTYL